MITAGCTHAGSKSRDAHKLARQGGSTGGGIAPQRFITKRNEVCGELPGVAVGDFCEGKQTVLAIRSWQQGKDLPAEDVDIVVHASSGYHTGVCGVYVDGQDATL